MGSPRNAFAWEFAIRVCQNISYKVPQNTDAWSFGLAGNSSPGIARRYAPRERLPLMKSVRLKFSLQNRDIF